MKWMSLPEGEEASYNPMRNNHAASHMTEWCKWRDPSYSGQLYPGTSLQQLATYLKFTRASSAGSRNETKRFKNLFL